MSKLTVWLDMDDVICNFLEELCSQYNNKYNKNLQVSDIKSWSLSPYLTEEEKDGVFRKPGFFQSLKPLDASIEIIKKLLKDEDLEVFIISSPINEHSMFEKYLWVREYLPFFPIENLILVGNKGDLLARIDKGILFDDCPEYLEKFRGITVVMDMPYNQDVKANYRVRENNWKEFYKIVKENTYE